MCKDVSMKDDVFAVIADPTRRHILQALAVERLAVGELVEELGVSQPTVSKHLKVLRTAGLVETEAVGQKRFYSITPTPLTTVTDWVDGLLAAPATPEATVAEPETASIPEEPEEAPAPVVDVPHPNTAGITFTPLTPFTPVLDNRVDEDIVESQEAQEAQEAASQESQEVAAQEAIRQVVADSEARARVTDSQAYSPAGEETGDDRGLLAKLTRWGRRSSR